MEIILGLDVSTHCIGVTIASENEGNLKILSVTHLRLKIPTKIKGTEALFKKSQLFTNYIEKLKEYNITQVIIEEPLIGSNNSLTVSTLLRFNGMISQSVYQKLGVIPYFISSYDARKYAFPELMAVRKFNKKGDMYPISSIRRSIKKNELVLFGNYAWDCMKKLILWNKISEIYPNIEWVYDKNGELRDENFDASDSLICVMGYTNMKKYENNEPVITNSREINTENEVIFEYEVLFCDKIYNQTITLTKNN